MIQLEPHADGVVLPVRAAPGARANGIRGDHHGALKVSVTQVAEKGKANKALVAVLGKELGLRKSQIELLSGSTSAHKKFLVRDMELPQLEARIQAAIARRGAS